MAKQKSKPSYPKSLWLVSAGLVGLGLLVALLLKGADVALFNPKGMVAHEQYFLMMISVIVMLVLAVPLMTFLYFFAWKYRDSNKKAMYNPHMRHGKLFVLAIWAIPSIFIVVLASIMIPATHKLEPQKTMDENKEALTIQVISMRWKWLFIYPEQGIASVNFVQLPTDTPVRFELTADEAPKSSFWIPHLGGQLYAMAGHSNPLYLIAEEPGDYPGSSAEINGAGFAGMKFTARASSKPDFDRWVMDMQNSSDVLDMAEYEKLLQPSEKHPVASYTLAETDLYAKMLMKYAGSHGHGPGGHDGSNRNPAQYHTGH
jgi:cytochrome o ubiquinol oxidase subunit II